MQILQDHKGRLSRKNRRMTTTFQPTTHTYRIGHAVVPSVTGVLQRAGLIAPFPPNVEPLAKRKAHIGRLVHQATARIDRGERYATTEDTEGYVEAYIAFRRRMGRFYQPGLIESPFVAEVYRIRYGMRPDRIGVLLGRPAIVDFKCVVAVQPHWGLQLSGYAAGAPAPMLWPYEYARHTLRLFPDGRFKLDDYSDKGDIWVFLAALSPDTPAHLGLLADWKRRHKIGEEM